MNFSLLSFGLFKLKIYGIFVALAFAIGVWQFYKALKKNNYSVDRFVHAFWHWVLIGFFVGRVFRLFVSPDIFQRYGWFGFFAFWDGGFLFHGVLIGFIVSAWYELRTHAGAFLRWIDAAVVPFLISLWIIDWGGFLTGAVYGTPAVFNGVDLPWGVQYETFGVDVLTPVHPITLYAFLGHVWIYRWIRRRKKFFSKQVGRMGLTTLVLVTGLDFVLSFLRFQEGVLWGGMFVSQWVLLLFFIGITLYWSHLYVFKGGIKRSR